MTTPVIHSSSRNETAFLESKGLLTFVKIWLGRVWNVIKEASDFIYKLAKQISNISYSILFNRNKVQARPLSPERIQKSSSSPISSLDTIQNHLLLPLQQPLLIDPSHPFFNQPHAQPLSSHSNQPPNPIPSPVSKESDHKSNRLPIPPLDFSKLLPSASISPRQLTPEKTVPFSSPLSSPSKHSPLNGSNRLEINPAQSQLPIINFERPNFSTAISDDILEHFVSQFLSNYSSLEEALADASIQDLAETPIQQPLKNVSGHYQLIWKDLPSKNENIFYIGELDQGRLHGKGRFVTCHDSIDKDLLLLEGCFNQNRLTSGLYCASPFIYESDHFEEGELTAQRGVIQKAHSLATYRGSFKNGLPDGDGIFYIHTAEGLQIFEQGSYQEGILLKGHRKEDGNVYIGSFREGKWLEKEGTIIFPDQAIYTGQVNEQNQPHGKGSMRSLKETLEGNFAEGVLHDADGSSEEHFSFPSLYEPNSHSDLKLIRKGSFNKGIFQGQKIELIWENDVENKTGLVDLTKQTITIQTHPSEIEEQTSYELDFSLFMENSQVNLNALAYVTGKGKIIRGDSTFEGLIRNGLPFGKGILTSNAEAREAEFNENGEEVEAAEEE